MSTHIADRTPDTAPVVESPAVRLRSRHLLGIEGLSPEEITLILDTSEAMKEVGNRPIKKVPALRGRTVVNLFFEPSTRTRTSFEIAEKRLSADTLSIATATSSVTKGESLLDTVRNLEAIHIQHVEAEADLAKSTADLERAIGGGLDAAADTQ